MNLLRFAAPLTAAVADTRMQTALTVESRAVESGFAVRVRVFSDRRIDGCAGTLTFTEARQNPDGSFSF